MRVVIDTNVLASALIRKQGASGEVLRRLREAQFVLVYSVPLLVELVDVLSRPRIQNKYNIQSEDITALINLIRLRGDLITPHIKINACRDPKDNFLPEAAIEGEADYLVTGEDDLLELNQYQSVVILRVAEFLVQT
jgi:putative PIN family toxin of toxin-antitoxin system